MEIVFFGGGGRRLSVRPATTTTTTAVCWKRVISRNCVRFKLLYFVSSFCRAFGSRVWPCCCCCCCCCCGRIFKGVDFERKDCYFSILKKAELIIFAEIHLRLFILSNIVFVRIGYLCVRVYACTRMCVWGCTCVCFLMYEVSEAVEKRLFSMLFVYWISVMPANRKWVFLRL